VSEDSPAPAPSVTVERPARRAAVVRVTGEADLALAPALGEAIAGEIAAGRRRIAIDLSGATFIDCATAGLLLDALAPLRDRGEGAVVLAGATGTVKRVLELLGVDAMLEMVPDLTWAARPLRPSARSARLGDHRPGPPVHSAAASPSA
jgi:anti-anti-sigma factor